AGPSNPSPAKHQTLPVDPDCAICMDPFEDSDRVRRLPCNHIFHVGCIDVWLVKETAACPLCR
ncbi:hypothetical protein BDK51DRAFT_10140, partial [Blyttiomyces helicus]